jgi:LPS-assembly protein
MAAADIRRVAGRFTEANRAVASSCRVCSTSETPLWEIRARRIVHDSVERQIYFEDASLRIGGVPVFWLPRLRMPDPTLTRATGFLMPRVRTSSALGFGVEVPFFIRLGDHRDLTLRPHVASKGVRSLGLRYRQAFRNGRVTVEGAISRDRLLPGRRGFLTVEGGFDLGRGFRLSFAGETASDRAYLIDYGISDKDRLDSRVEIARTRRDEHVSVRLTHFVTLREGETNDVLPSLVGDALYHRRIAVPGIGGVAGLRLAAHSHYRSSTADALGRDVARASVTVDWQRGWVLPAGVAASVRAEVAADVHRVVQDARWPGRVTNVTPGAAVELRWPLVRRTAAGAQDVLEPVVQLVWTRAAPAGTVPDEDSVLVEFDEGNLWAFNRFAGIDRREDGARLNLGLAFTRITPAGWTWHLLAGRVIRSRDPGQFTAASGLAGRRSDWLASAAILGPDGMGVQARALFGDGLDLTRSELRLRMQQPRYGLDAAWVWAVADPAENRPQRTSELVLDGSYRLTDQWSTLAQARYDFVADRATTAAVGLEFANECLRLALSLSRRFTSSTTVRPTTDFGLSVDFVGFGSGPAPGPSGRVCRR